MNNFIDNFDPKVRQYMNKILLSQEKILQLEKNNSNRNDKIIYNISKKIKRTKENLLMNTYESFRPKQEIIRQLHENLNPPFHRYGSNDWVMSLRLPKNFKGVRISYVNNGCNSKEAWHLMREEFPKETEIVRKTMSTQQSTRSKVFNLKTGGYLDSKLKTCKIDLISQNNYAGLFVIYK